MRKASRCRGVSKHRPYCCRIWKMCDCSPMFCMFFVVAVLLAGTLHNVVFAEPSENYGKGLKDPVDGNLSTWAISLDVKEGSIANMFDRVLEMNLSKKNNEKAVLETVARVTHDKPKKNDTQEENGTRSFQLQDVFNLDENGADDMPTLIDRKDNVFIMSNPKSKYPILQLDVRFISDLVVVIVSAAIGGIAFACLGQPVITGYLLAGSIIGPGGLSFVSEMVQVCGAKSSEGVFVGAFLSMSSTAVVLKFLMERSNVNALHGQVTVGTLILQDCAVGLLFALLPVLGGNSGLLQGLMSMMKSLVVLSMFLTSASVLSWSFVPRFLKLMIRLSSQTNELYQLASVAFCLLVAWVEPIRNLFAALFLSSIGMLIHVQFLWNHVDILLASVILVIIAKTLVVTIVVKGFGYSIRTAFLVGMSLAQIGEFAFVLLSRASNLHLVEGKLYLLLLGTTALSLVTTPLLFKMIPAIMHLGVLMHWFPPDGNQTEVVLKGENFPSGSTQRIVVTVQGSQK